MSVYFFIFGIPSLEFFIEYPLDIKNLISSFFSIFDPKIKFQDFKNGGTASRISPNLNFMVSRLLLS